VAVPSSCTPGAPVDPYSDGVVESTLFRPFGSTVEILKATVVEPWRRVLQALVDGVRSHPADALGTSLREIVTGLTRLVLANRDALRSLVGTDQRDDRELSAVVDQIRRKVISSADESAIGDGAAGDEALFGLVMGTFLLSNWIFRDDLAHVDEDALIDGIVSLVMHGLPDDAQLQVSGPPAD
jgi:AcrR family transcriptional regulator